MANYKLNYSGEKIDELLTKIDNLGTGTDAKSGTVKLSSATYSNSGVSDGVAATPAAVKTAYDAAIAVNDAVDALIPKVDKNTDSIAANKEAVSQLKTDMDTKANKSDVLSLEEIQASTDLSGKIASASALKDVLPFYLLVDGNYDFNNIPYERCYGRWFSTVQNAPSTKDGNYIKIGDIIIAIDWNNAKFIKHKWGGYLDWVSF